MTNAINALEPIFFPSECDIDGELFYPIADASKSIDCMVGYFTSGSISELARTLSTYLAKPTCSPLRLVISPDLPNAEDRLALDEAIRTDKNLIPLLFPNFELDANSLRANAVKALIYLVSSQQLIIKVAIKDEGILHTKCWIFETDKGHLTISGSGNATKSGLSTNFEHLNLHRSWKSSDDEKVVEHFKKRFQLLWNNLYDGIPTYGLNRKTLAYIEAISHSINNEKVKKALIKQLTVENHQHEFEKNQKQAFTIPDWLKYDEGDFSHQGSAVRAWMQNAYSGILSIATGGGKTLTSLVAASIVSRESSGLLVVIAVPTIALVQQWIDEVKVFGVDAINGNGKSHERVSKDIRRSKRNLSTQTSVSECIVVTHEGLKSDWIKEVIPNSKGYKTLLIADEVHNLGSTGFISNPPQFFDYKLGLSATVERQYDESGTQFLLEYFGGVVFSYDLEEAIGKCLVPYDYCPIEVKLTAEEEDRFIELTAEIKKLAYAKDYADGSPAKDALSNKCMERRRVVESAENKIKAFSKLINERPNLLDKSLIFCTDKNANQIKSINTVLLGLGVPFHQLTQEETSNRKKLTRLISEFNNGSLKTLTSMRVLDEGFNVPQTENAFLLASNTVRRQWIQRLGRVLRLSPATGKTKSTIYDFVAMPICEGANLDFDLRRLLKGEFERITFFSELSQNPSAPGGGLELATKILKGMSKL